MDCIEKLATCTTLILVGFISGCATPKHTDMMIFGTNTQFGVSAGTESSTANPGVNIGYRRQEVVLMPLYVNGEDSQYKPDKVEDKPSIEEAKYTGIDGLDKDTYSVFASFGARGSGGTGSGGKVQIAQTFATGLAARTLATAGAALVNTSDQAALAKATPPSVTRVERSAAFAEEKTIRDKSALLKQVDVLDSGRAHTLLSSPPVAFTDKELAELSFMLGGRSVEDELAEGGLLSGEGNDGNAKQLLKYFFAEVEPSEGTLDAWKTAME